MKKRKSTINKAMVSKHTRRFRVLFAFDPTALSGHGCLMPCGESPPIIRGRGPRQSTKKAHRKASKALSYTAIPPQLKGWVTLPPSPDEAHKSNWRMTPAATRVRDGRYRWP